MSTYTNPQVSPWKISITHGEKPSLSIDFDRPIREDEKADLLDHVKYMILSWMK